MKAALLLLLNCLSLTAFTQSGKRQAFNITGTVKEMNDGNFLYLSDLTEGTYKDIDSTQVLKESFHFMGTLNDATVKYAIHTKGFSDRVDFWIEPGETTISTKIGAFKKAIIKGSKAQQKKYELDSIGHTTKNEQRDYILFIQKNPSSIVSAHLLQVYSSSWNKDTVSMLFQQLSADVKNSVYGQKISNFLTLNKSLKIGDPYVDFGQPNTNGTVIHLSDYHGKIVLLEFWGSWCAPCREGHPEMIKIYNQFKNKGFEILGVAADTDKKQLADAIQNDSLPWQNISDLKGNQNTAALIYGVSYYPANFLIDGNGVIIAKDLRDEQLFNKLKELLP